MNPNAILPGTSLRNDAYTIERVLGQGGFGITYLADFKKLATKVAIKEFFLSGHCARDTKINTITPVTITGDQFVDYKEKFIEEARTLAQFNHPSIVSITDIFEENNTAYFVMNYIKGKSLNEVIKEKGPLSEAEAKIYITQIAEALKEVHQKQILHRDIKPSNVIVREDGRIVLIDFGTARSFVEGKTMTHTAMLTPGFAPMEQYSTKQKRGFYSDLYALGATFYACLTGSPPPSAIDRLDEPEIEPIPGVSSHVFETIQTALDTDVNKRFQTVDDFLARLNNQKQPPNKVEAPETVYEFDRDKDHTIIEDFDLIEDPIPMRSSKPEENPQPPVKVRASPKKHFARMGRFLLIGAILFFIGWVIDDFGNEEGPGVVIAIGATIIFGGLAIIQLIIGLYKWMFK